MLRYYCYHDVKRGRLLRLLTSSSTSSSLLDALKKINKDKDKSDNNVKAIPLTLKTKTASKFTINTNTTDAVKSDLTNSIRDLFKKASDNSDVKKSRPWNTKNENNSNSSNTTNTTNSSNEQRDNTNTTTPYQHRTRSNKDAYDYGKRYQQQEQEWKRTNTNTSTSNTNTTRNVRNELLESIANNLTDPLEEAEVDEITPGELRYSQYEEKMKHKREKFMKRYDLDNMPQRPKPVSISQSSSQSSSLSLIHISEPTRPY